MLAAAISSVDSGVNSITTTVKTDFLERLEFGPKTEKWECTNCPIAGVGKRYCGGAGRLIHETHRRP